MSTGTTLAFAFTAALVGLFGVLIRYGGAVELVAGYDEDRVTDEAGLAAFVGRNLLLVAGLSAVVAAVAHVRAVDASLTVWVAYTLAVVVIAAWTVRGGRRYERSR
jgi:succinate-acetate transporter protein